MTWLRTHLLAAVAALAFIADSAASDDTKGDTQMETGHEVTALLGKSIDDAQHALGTPMHDEQFLLGAQVNEFRIELTNLFGETVRSENPPTIREATWSVSPDQNVTLWFTDTHGEGDWHAVHFLKWHPDDQF